MWDDIEDDNVADGSQPATYQESAMPVADGTSKGAARRHRKRTANATNRALREEIAQINARLAAWDRVEEQERVAALRGLSKSAQNELRQKWAKQDSRSIEDLEHGLALAKSRVSS